MAILITRPDDTGKELVTMLNKAGIANLHFPFFSVSAGHELNELPNKISQLSAGDYVFCVSKNAVKYAHDSLTAVGLHWRQDLNYLAVGKSSAQYFASTAQVNVNYPITQETSEGLLDLPQLQQLENKQILILKGNGGREYFAQQAELRGAKITKLEIYQRIPIDYNAEEQVDLFKRANIQQILFTSEEILHALIDFIPREEQNWLKSCQLITSSDRLANLAQQAGWDKGNIIVSPKADNATLVNTLLTL
ncbi:uroporphyrinogen-III synthase [Pasteurellaceae bacterium 22721_9_1]